MDAQERKDSLTEVRKRLETCKELLRQCGCKYLFWDVHSLMDDLDDEIRDADEEVCREEKLERMALTRAYFKDSISAYDKL